MWITAEKAGLTPKEIDEICEKLISEAHDEADTLCHDCGVEPGQPHLEGCDVARCTTCKGQRLGCDCEEENEDIWTGIWPGLLEALEMKLICCWDGDLKWTADLNTYTIRKMMKS